MTSATKKSRSHSLEDRGKKIPTTKSNNNAASAAAAASSVTENTNLLNKKLDYYKNLYESKNREIEIIESTNRRRIERLSYFEKQNQLLKQHLKSYIEDKPEKIESNSLHKHENLYNELTLQKHDKKQLYQEKLKAEEELDILKVNYEKQNTIINELNMELKYKLDELRLENELIVEEKSKVIEIINKELNEKCEMVQSLNAKVEKLMKSNGPLLNDRIKLSEMCSQMTEENNRLYKKWILIKKNENKQKILIERMKKMIAELHEKKNLKRKTKKKRKCYETHTDTDVDILEIEREYDSNKDSGKEKINDYFDESLTDDEISIEEDTSKFFFPSKTLYDHI